MKYIFFCVFLFLCMIKSTYAILWINDFEGGVQDLDANWSLTNITSSSTQTAEATGNSGYISAATGRYSTGTTTDGNWGSGTYDGQYFSLYVYASNTGTLQIRLVEEDNVGASAVDSTWSTTAENLNWTGWRYLMYKLPEGATENDFTRSGGDNDWNPDYSLGPPEIRGVKEINFVITGGADIYIDQIAISNVSTDVGWVREIFPSNDNNDNSTDITLSALPPTISAVLGLSADSSSSRDNRIIMVNSTAPTTNLCSGDGDTDGLGGWLVTHTGSFIDGNNYTVFIHPVNSSDEPGKCEVITFTTSAPSSTIENKYKRSLIN